MRITSKGQVTIPQHLRDKYGLLPETEVDFVERDGAITILPADSVRPDRGDRALAALRGTGNRKLSTDELLRLTRD
ncbi:AbrB/MazE/SpoVT family DNA-binding domain-containing protein [Rhodococcus sp. NPDC058514]|uniref:AbrB/MazE/SpoVT family DNA-binding domain-containing protein n=1 Tax=unclassified Rhodococcus (in: high G+C Gram-positive bacteria) TaxID=192944 RepID=UPI00365FB73B